MTNVLKYVIGTGQTQVKCGIPHRVAGEVSTEMVAWEGARALSFSQALLRVEEQEAETQLVMSLHGLREKRERRSGKFFRGQVCFLRDRQPDGLAS